MCPQSRILELSNSDIATHNDALSGFVSLSIVNLPIPQKLFSNIRDNAIEMCELLPQTSSLDRKTLDIALRNIRRSLPYMKVLDEKLTGLLESSYKTVARFIGASEGDISANIELAYSESRPKTISDVLNESKEPSLPQRLRGMPTESERELQKFIHETYESNKNKRPCDQDYSVLNKILNAGLSESMQNVELTDKSDTYTKLLDEAMAGAVSKLSAALAENKLREKQLYQQRHPWAKRD